MRRDRLLLILTFAGSILLWWPLIIEISRVTHWWLPLPLIVLESGLATVLFDQRWWQFAVVSGIGTCVGICSGYAIWQPADGIETAYSALLIIAATLSALFLSLIANFVAQGILLSSSKLRHDVWIVLGCCYAMGPIAVALTPRLLK